MGEFKPPANWMITGCDGKFISFAAAMEKRTPGSAALGATPLVKRPAPGPAAGLLGTPTQSGSAKRPRLVQDGWNSLAGAMSMAVNMHSSNAASYPADPEA